MTSNYENFDVFPKRMSKLEREITYLAAGVLLTATAIGGTIGWAVGTYVPKVWRCMRGVPK